jgi:hypothetical protein
LIRPPLQRTLFAMTARQYVFLDPDGMAGGTGWLYVVVRAQTRVVYQQQYGGTACRQGQVEGFLVPVSGPDSLAQLRDLFEGHFRGAGTWNYQWRIEEVDRLRKAVAAICYWACNGETEVPHPLELDEQQLGEADEAWIPVLTPDGAGILVWSNSD